MMDYGLNALSAQSQLVTQNRDIPKIDTKAEDKALREQTDAFEAIIIKMLMDNAMKDEKDLFSSQNDPGDKIYKSMYRDELSKASAGSFGFSQMLYDYLSQRNS
jgi:Rod binding domain-containing protein